MSGAERTWSGLVARAAVSSHRYLYDNAVVCIKYKPTGCTWKGSIQKFIKTTFFPDSDKDMPSRSTVGLRDLTYLISRLLVCILIMKRKVMSVNNESGTRLVLENN